MTARYVIGPAYAVVRGGTVVVLPEKVTPELVAELWGVLEHGGGVVPVLEVLTGAFGASLASLPPFALAVADGRRVQVAARGAASVTVARADGRDHVSGDGVTTWAERTFDDVVDLAVQVGTTEPDADLVDVRALPLTSGVVLVASVGVRLTQDAVAAAAPRRADPAPDPWELDDVDPVPVTDAPVAPAPVATGASDASDATIVPEATFAPVGLAPGAGAEPEPVPESDDTGSSPAEEPSAGEPPVEETTGFGHLWGSTVMRGVEAAAVRPPEEDDEDEDGPEEPASPSPGTAEPGTVGTGTTETGTTEPSTAEPSTAEPGRPAPEDEIDGSTVMSSAIADLRAVAGETLADPVTSADPAVEHVVAAGVPDPAVLPGPSFASAPLPGRPAILARSCGAGHPNPPQRDHCATCGQALVGEARQVPRPSLGVMAVSGGPRVALDRPVVVGRRPRSPRAASDDLPRLVTVPSPQQDISRSHLEVRLEGWHVLVSDMSTTNGTTLLRSGQPPLRLHPGEPVLVVASDVVDLGDGVTLTFEGIL
ncbi:FHA domain-containing protein [Isoptericola sp. S6320L]|uniref:FHA domain-containing protein n=1 Tax=Isoptericola sp. S6320L TaxID=2926411 RepID=UPI001FF38069|nr:FHA domain-containing protein [Isoptericola sp. S6320L]MCK0118047.1 FHA domain-containing protein [Isoptericola sp. S6320L]